MPASDEILPAWGAGGGIGCQPVESRMAGSLSRVFSKKMNVSKESSATVRLPLVACFPSVAAAKPERWSVPID